MAKMRVVIYLRGEDEGKLDDAEKQCSDYADRFGWQVLEVIRHQADAASGISRLVLRVSKLRAQIIVTDTLGMLSPEANARNDFMEAIERQQCIVHPINVPPRHITAANPAADGRTIHSGSGRHNWTTVLDGQRLQQIRRQRELSQEQLAELAGISLSTMARLERHDRSPCRSWTLGRLAVALDQTPASITAGPGRPAEGP
jgi:DNA-binding XRE family transcriptional regulator